MMMAVAQVSVWLLALALIVNAQHAVDDGEGSVKFTTPLNGSTITGNELVFAGKHDFSILGTTHLYISNHIHERFPGQDRFSMYMFGLQVGWHKARIVVIDEEGGGKTIGETETIFYVADPAEAYQPSAEKPLSEEQNAAIAKLTAVLEQKDEASSVAAYKEAIASEGTPNRLYRFQLYMLATKYQDQLPTAKIWNAAEPGPPQCFRHGRDYVLDHLHPNDPYANFDSKGLIYNPYEHQGYDERLIRILIGLTQPGIIAEVGSWKGGSAILMTGILKDYGRQCEAKIVCIDTWLGTSTDYKMQRHTEAVNGHPNVYPQYMHNIIEADATDTVVPFPAPSTLAAEYFRHKQDLEKERYGLQLVFIDANHDYQDVKMELENYFPLLAPGGMMFGDDYSMFGVTRAVTEFRDKHNLTLQVHTSRMWVLV